MKAGTSHILPIRMAIFASGGGSNARAICRYFAQNERIKVSLLLSNRESSGVFELGESYSIPALLLSKDQVKDGAYLLSQMQAHQIDLIVLAGYLKHVPDPLVNAFPHRMVNIHPSLLPAYGGKGMYGIKVHEAVIKHKETLSGLTIHYVNEVYDQGEIIFQAHQAVDPNWKAADLQQAILKLEHTYYPQVIQTICESLASKKVE
ncbi:MAG: phosphoribosylglycinamide formyltransferase [Bacteroidota bacterium]